MAGTFSVRLSGTLTNGLHSESFGSTQNRSIVQTGQGEHSPIVVVGTGVEAMPLGDITTPGYIYLKNLDTGNYVTYGVTSGAGIAAFGRLDPSGDAWIQLEPTTNVSWQANTAACNVQMKLFEY